MSPHWSLHPESTSRCPQCRLPRCGCSWTSSHCGKDKTVRGEREQAGGGWGQEKEDSREEMHSINALLDALLPVLHEVTQGEQRVIADSDPVFRRPGFHGYQDDASVELLLVDLKEIISTWLCILTWYVINHLSAQFLWTVAVDPSERKRVLWDKAVD